MPVSQEEAGKKSNQSQSRNSNKTIFSRIFDQKVNKLLKIGSIKNKKSKFTKKLKKTFKNPILMSFSPFQL